MSIRGSCLGQQRVPWGEGQADRDAGHPAQEFAPGSAMRARVASVFVCKFVHTHSAHLTLRG